MNKFLIIAIACIIPISGIAKTKPTPTVDYNQIINEAENQIDDLTNKLQSSLIQLRDTQTELTKASTALTDATNQTQVLQSKIDEETKTLNKTIDDLNKEISIAQEWKVKYDKAEKNLWWYRRIGIGIGSLVALYGVFLLLKVAGKLPL